VSADPFVQLIASPLDLAFGASVGRVPDSFEEAALGGLRLSIRLLLHILQFSPKACCAPIMVFRALNCWKWL
jgi:hypothetical protein